MTESSTIADKCDDNYTMTISDDWELVTESSTIANKCDDNYMMTISDDW